VGARRPGFEEVLRGDFLNAEGAKVTQRAQKKTEKMKKKRKKEKEQQTN
jgi:hypothetical protein